MHRYILWHISSVFASFATSCSLFCDGHPTISVHSTFCQCNILPASCLLLASHLHTRAYLTCESLAYCLRVSRESQIAWELLVGHSHVTCNCKNSLPYSWAVPQVTLYYWIKHLFSRFLCVYTVENVSCVKWSWFKGYQENSKIVVTVGMLVIVLSNSYLPTMIICYQHYRH